MEIFRYIFEMIKNLHFLTILQIVQIKILHNILPGPNALFYIFFFSSSFYFLFYFFVYKFYIINFVTVLIYHRIDIHWFLFVKGWRATGNHLLRGGAYGYAHVTSNDPNLAYASRGRAQQNVSRARGRARFDASQ